MSVSHLRGHMRRRAAVYGVTDGRGEPDGISIPPDIRSHARGQPHRSLALHNCFPRERRDTLVGTFDTLGERWMAQAARGGSRTHLGHCPPGDRLRCHELGWMNLLADTARSAPPPTRWCGPAQWLLPLALRLSTGSPPNRGTNPTGESERRLAPIGDHGNPHTTEQGAQRVGRRSASLRRPCHRRSRAATRGPATHIVAGTLPFAPARTDSRPGQLGHLVEGRAETLWNEVARER